MSRPCWVIFDVLYNNFCLFLSWPVAYPMDYHDLCLNCLASKYRFQRSQKFRCQTLSQIGLVFTMTQNHPRKRTEIQPKQKQLQQKRSQHLPIIITKNRHQEGLYSKFSCRHHPSFDIITNCSFS